MKIVIVLTAPLSMDRNKVFELIDKDESLQESIEVKKDELKEDDVEIFEEDHNILITEKGYYIIGFLDRFEIDSTHPDYAEVLKDFNKHKEFLKDLDDRLNNKDKDKDSN